MNYQLTGSKEDMLASFRDLVKQGKFTDSKGGGHYDCKNKFKRCDTVDGNPTAAYKQCHPYTGQTVISGRVGLNGKIGSGVGTYGD